MTTITIRLDKKTRDAFYSFVPRGMRGKRVVGLIKNYISWRTLMKDMSVKKVRGFR